MSTITVNLQPVLCKPATVLKPSFPPPPNPADKFIVFSPVITAHAIPPSGKTPSQVIVRLTLLVDAAVPPTSITYESGSASVSGSILSCNFQFDPADSKPTGQVNLIYAEFVFDRVQITPDQGSVSIDMVEVFFHDPDPETSRGTVTNVQES